MTRLRRFFAVCATLLVCSNYAYAQKPQKYLSRDEVSNPIKWLAPPPDSTSQPFLTDIARYMWGKQQRLDPQRRQIAIRDAEYSLERIIAEFSVPFGLQISKESTPEIYTLLYNALASCGDAERSVKKHYMRTRPFAFFSEPSLTPADEEALRHNGSYPSGHTVLGFASALLLSEINPAAQDTLLARGQMYGESRVIVGAHWQSDVDAGKLVAASLVVTLHTKPLFREQMQKARDEFARLTTAQGDASKQWKHQAKKNRHHQPR